MLGNHLEIPEKLGIKVEKHISMKNYIPYVNRFADLPTILEAYQYLMKRYVTNARERKRKWIKAKNTSSAILAFKKAQSSRARSLKAQCSKELKFMEPDQNHPDQQHHKKNIAGYLFSLCHKISNILRVSVQGVKSLGGHFACLCRGFEFYEVQKFFFYYFSKRKWKYFYTFNHFYSENSSKRAK